MSLTRALLCLALLLPACSSEQIDSPSVAETVCDSALDVTGYSASPTSGVAPLKVRFEVTAPTELRPECGELRFRWDFSNDGVIDTLAKQGMAEYAFAHPGTYTTFVKVSTLLGSAVTHVTFKTYVRAPTTPTTPIINDPRPASGTLRMSVTTQEFPLVTTEFTAASQITATSVMQNLNDFIVDCTTPSRGATNSSLFIYEDGVEVGRSRGGIVLYIMGMISFSPGTNVVDESAVNGWKTPTDEAFSLYPGVFTLYTTPKFYCGVPVYSTPTTIVVRP